MKFRVTLKDPDSLIDCIEDSLNEPQPIGLNEEEVEAVHKKREEERLELASKWFQYSEYLTVEIDTEAKTCVVVPVDEEGGKEDN